MRAFRGLWQTSLPGVWPTNSHLYLMRPVSNLPMGLANAFFDSVPFLAITGNVPTSQFNRGAFQETYRH